MIFFNLKPNSRLKICPKNLCLGGGSETILTEKKADIRMQIGRKNRWTFT